MSEDAMREDAMRDGLRGREPSGHDLDELPQLDDRDAQLLLDGGLPPTDVPDAYAHLVDLFAAAAGPARPDELTGEASALAAFRAARGAARHPETAPPGLATTAVASRRPPRPAQPTAATSRDRGRADGTGATVRTRGRRAGTVARPAAILAALLLGGLGVTAATAILSAGIDRPDRIATTTRPGGPYSTAGGNGAGGVVPTTVGHGGAAGQTSTTSDTNQGAPPAAREGLCQALRAGKGAGSGTKQQAEAFEALVEAAGGADRVDAYCRGGARSGPSDDTRAGQPSTGNRPASPPTTTRPPSGPPAGASGTGGSHGQPKPDTTRDDAAHDASEVPSPGVIGTREQGLPA